MKNLMDRIKDVQKERESAGEPASVKEQKRWGEVRITLYREGAYRTESDGSQVPLGGDQNGNYDRIFEALGLDKEDSGSVADLLEVLAEDIASGKLHY